MLNALICTISENSNNPTKWGEYHQSHFVAEVRMVTCPKSQNNWTPKKRSKPLHCIAPSQKCLLCCKEILKAHSLLLFHSYSWWKRMCQVKCLLDVFICKCYCWDKYYFLISHLKIHLKEVSTGEIWDNLSIIACWIGYTCINKEKLFLTVR